MTDVDPTTLFQGSDFEATLEKIATFQATLGEALETQYEGVSQDSTILISGTVNGYTAVQIDARATMRPDPDALGRGVREAMLDMAEKTGAGFRSFLASRLGIVVPAVDSTEAGLKDLADGAGSAGRDELDTLRRDFPELGQRVDQAVSEQLGAAAQKVEVASSTGVVRAVYSGAGALESLDFDRMLLRDIDNLALADAVLEVLQAGPSSVPGSFSSALADARSEMDAGFDRATQSLDEAMRPYR